MDRPGKTEEDGKSQTTLSVLGQFCCGPGVRTNHYADGSLKPEGGYVCSSVDKFFEDVWLVKTAEVDPEMIEKWRGDDRIDVTKFRVGVRARMDEWWAKVQLPENKDLRELGAIFPRKEHFAPVLKMYARDYLDDHDVSVAGEDMELQKVHEMLAEAVMPQATDDPHQVDFDGMGQGEKIVEPAAFESDQEKIVEEPCVSLTDENLEAFNSLSESEPNFKSAEEGSLGSMVDYSESEISCDGNISELEADDTVFTPHGSPRREDSLEEFWELEEEQDFDEDATSQADTIFNDIMDMQAMMEDGTWEDGKSVKLLYRTDSMVMLPWEPCSDYQIQLPNKEYCLRLDVSTFDTRGEGIHHIGARFTKVDIIWAGCIDENFFSNNSNPSWLNALYDPRLKCLTNVAAEDRELSIHSGDLLCVLAKVKKGNKNQTPCKYFAIVSFSADHDRDDEGLSPVVCADVVEVIMRGPISHKIFEFVGEIRSKRLQEFDSFIPTSALRNPDYVGAFNKHLGTHKRYNYHRLHFQFMASPFADLRGLYDRSLAWRVAMITGCCGLDLKMEGEAPYRDVATGEFIMKTMNAETVRLAQQKHLGNHSRALDLSALVFHEQLDIPLLDLSLPRTTSTRRGKRNAGELAS